MQECPYNLEDYASIPKRKYCTLRKIKRDPNNALHIRNAAVPT